MATWSEIDAAKAIGKPHKVMTKEEYDRYGFESPHIVAWNYDGCGNVAWWPLTAAEQVRASEIKKRIEYWRTKDLHNGWRADESGPCCSLCEMRDEHFTGRADALKAKLGCRDPFQVNCGCHLIPRQAVKNRMIEELSSLANTC